MSEVQGGGGGSRIMLYALLGAGLLLVAYVLIPSVGGESGVEPPVAETSGTPDASSASTVDANEIDAAGAPDDALAEAESPPEPGSPAAYHAAGLAPPMEEIPPGILEDFRRGTASVSEERRELMERGMEDMPDHVRRDFERAATPEIPSDVLADFENPYRPMPPGHEKYFEGVVEPEREQR